MIIEFLTFLLISIFLVLAGIHFYWGLGGRWAAADAAPVSEQNKPVLNTGPLSCFIVGGGLVLFALYYLIFVLHVKSDSRGLMLTPGWIIPAIFFIRAIGDFKYVGLTKKIKHSTFAWKDTWYYTPLCLVITVLALLVHLLS